LFPLGFLVVAAPTGTNHRAAPALALFLPILTQSDGAAVND
jgi:hypothetical protein